MRLSDGGENGKIFEFPFVLFLYRIIATLITIIITIAVESSERDRRWSFLSESWWREISQPVSQVSCKKGSFPSHPYSNPNPMEKICSRSRAVVVGIRHSPRRLRRNSAFITGSAVVGGWSNPQPCWVPQAFSPPPPLPTSSTSGSGLIREQSPWAENVVASPVGQTTFSCNHIPVVFLFLSIPSQPDHVPA